MYPHNIPRQNAQSNLPADEGPVELVAEPPIPPPTLFVHPKVGSVDRHQTVVFDVNL